MPPEGRKPFHRFHPENRTVICHFKQAGLVFHGSGKGSGLVTKELTLQQVFAESRTAMAIIGFAPVEPGSDVPVGNMCVIEEMPIKSLVTYPASGSKFEFGKKFRFEGMHGAA